jgi:hypothetical protein
MQLNFGSLSFGVLAPLKQDPNLFMKKIKHNQHYIYPPSWGYSRITYLNEYLPTLSNKILIYPQERKPMPPFPMSNSIM